MKWTVTGLGESTISDKDRRINQNTSHCFQWQKKWGHFQGSIDLNECTTGGLMLQLQKKKKKSTPSIRGSVSISLGFLNLRHGPDRQNDANYNINMSISMRKKNCTFNFILNLFLSSAFLNLHGNNTQICHWWWQFYRSAFKCFSSKILLVHHFLVICQKHSTVWEVENCSKYTQFKFLYY